MNAIQEMKRNVLALEHAVLPVCGHPEGDELPQVATLDDIEMDLICEMTGKPWEVIQGDNVVEH